MRALTAISPAGRNLLMTHSQCGLFLSPKSTTLLISRTLPTQQQNLHSSKQIVFLDNEVKHILNRQKRSKKRISPHFTFSGRALYMEKSCASLERTRLRNN